MSELTAIGFWADHRHPGWPDPREFIAGDLDAGEREAVASYLERGAIVQVYRGWSHCRVCGFGQNGHADLSDGTYLWPEGLAHYVREHQVRLPGEFTSHVAARLRELGAAKVDDTWWSGQRGPSTDAVCPHCGGDGIPVLIGLPTAAAREAAGDGQILLGGCLSQGGDADPQWQCRQDPAHRWTSGGPGNLAWRQALRRAMAGRPHCERCGGLSTLLVYRQAEEIFAQDLAEGGAMLTFEQGPPGVNAQRRCLGCGHTW